jgi:hypothetical protein
LNSPTGTARIGRTNSAVHIGDSVFDNQVHTGTVSRVSNGPDMSTLPFEGFNVEELWNWFTSSGGDMNSDVLDWVDPGFEIS